MLASNASAALPMSTTFRAAMTARFRRSARRAIGGAVGRMLCSGRSRGCSRRSVLRCCSAIIVSLATRRCPALQKFGPRSSSPMYGIRSRASSARWSPIVGTLVTSLIALLIGVPVSFGIALFLTEIVPGAGCGGRSARRSSCWRRSRRSSTACGACSCSRRSSPITSQPLLHRDPRRPLAGRTAVPGRADRHRHADGRRDPRRHGDPVHRVGDARRVRDRPAGAEGIRVWPRLHDVGSRPHVVLPYTRVGVIGGIMLGLGRALGETMAVTFVIGNAYRIRASLFEPGNSIASALANEFNEAADPLHRGVADRARPRAVRDHPDRAGRVRMLVARLTRERRAT